MRNDGMPFFGFAAERKRSADGIGERARMTRPAIGARMRTLPRTREYPFFPSCGSSDG